MTRYLAFAAVIALVALTGAQPAAQSGAPRRVFISEVHPSGSGNGTYAADWFEVTNTGTNDVDITGWRMDDSNPALATSVPLTLTGPNGVVTTIPPGKSAIFLETANPANTFGLFKTMWFGNNPPADVLIGSYTGSGVGLSTSGDAVNLLTATGAIITGVTFGAANATNTFDNTTGFGGASVATLSAIGVNGAFDEGFSDTDGDGVKNCADLDDDNDGIADGVDPASLNPVNETFSDGLAPLTGTTSGMILTRNGHAVAIGDATTDAPDTGVQVLVVGGPGSGPILIQLDGKAETIALPDGAYVLTDPANVSTVTVTAGGPASISAILNGLPLVIVVGNGSSVTYTETPGPEGTLSGLSIDGVVGNVSVNGKPLAGPMTLIGPPLQADACKDGEFGQFNFPGTFKTQGDCVSYVTTGAKNGPSERR